MKNLLLDQLSADDSRRLEPYLKTIPIKQHFVLFEAEEPIKHVYLERGLTKPCARGLLRASWRGGFES